MQIFNMYLSQNQSLHMSERNNVIFEMHIHAHLHTQTNILMYEYTVSKTAATLPISLFQCIFFPLEYNFCLLKAEC